TLSEVYGLTSHVCKWRSRVGRAVLAALALTTLGGVTPAHAADSSRPIGDIRVFATLGYPGTPGGLAVDGQTVYVDTSAANFDRPFDASDKLYAYNVDSRQQLGEPSTSRASTRRRPRTAVVRRPPPVGHLGRDRAGDDHRPHRPVPVLRGRKPPARHRHLPAAVGPSRQRPPRGVSSVQRPRRRTVRSQCAWRLP